MTFRINDGQVEGLASLIAERSTEIASLLRDAIHANAAHRRGGSVSLLLKVARNNDDPTKIDVDVQTKIKAPRSPLSDLTSWSEPELMTRFDLGEVPGQQRIA